MQEQQESDDDDTYDDALVTVNSHGSSISNIVICTFFHNDFQMREEITGVLILSSTN